MKVELSNENYTIVIIGAAGDLAQRKLVPALFQLRCKGRLPEGLRIVGFSRSDYSDDQFRDVIWNGTREFRDVAVRQDEWEMFARDLYYVSWDLRQSSDIVRLGQRFDDPEANAATTNRLFYMSIAPNLYEPAIQNLGASATERTTSPSTTSTARCWPAPVCSPAAERPLSMTSGSCCTLWQTWPSPPDTSPTAASGRSVEARTTSFTPRLCAGSPWTAP